ncbi:MAG: [FeFe] hydrogenase H-cluster radical SAM maturase HydG [Bacteroidales bacterium]|nr:[FeFe] hydrogenase H-cluster radical SAM maturase HydG [Bacteroidales bacterium]
MKFTPEKYNIPDEPMKPFIDPQEIQKILDEEKSDKGKIKEIIEKSLNKNRLTLQETAALVNTTDPELIEQIKEGAKTLKNTVYGNRIVLFAPLYIGNKCSNNCTYCGFRSTNTDAVRKTLNDDEIIKEIEALEDNGQKRLILVYGDHDQYNPEFIARTVKIAYNVKKGNGEIRRVNINAAPLDINGFRIIKEAGIGTYQVFQETYHPEAYKTYHLRGKKADYNYRLTSLDRAQEAGLDDVGIGALFGLYNWKYEVLGLVRHTNHFEACYNVGPHTISFPRIKDASMLQMGNKYFVDDNDFAKLIAILRLAVPYTGMILTARESKEIRDEVIHFGVSQIDGGTKLELGSYSKNLNEDQDLNKGQFRINDSRSLNEIIDELLDKGMLPSFCTACYRLGRTGEHFMEFSVPGFIKRYCTPNAILTLAEYLWDYATEKTAIKGWKVIEKNIEELNDESTKNKIREKLNLMKNGKRDLYF